MNLILAGLVLLVVGTQAQWYKFPSQAYQGARDMRRAYNDMLDANWKYSDKYFHARGNRDAASRGAGGRFAARVISDAREISQRIPAFFRNKGSSGQGRADSAADQEANRWGRSGGDPNRYRPRGLPSRY